MLIEKIKAAIYTLTLGTTLIGGHMTGVFLLYKTDTSIVAVFASLTFAILAFNALAFLSCFVLQARVIKDKGTILPAAASLLINIPISFIYLTIIIGYGT